MTTARVASFFLLRAMHLKMMLCVFCDHHMAENITHAVGLRHYSEQQRAAVLDRVQAGKRLPV
eukprot:1814448-Amphidinium_carterae.3